MDEQFNNDLKNHIREVFENFEDSSADEGWLLLREKFPEKGKDRGFIWFWWGSAAAIILVLLGIGTWVNYQKDEPKKLSYKHNRAPHYETNIARQEQKTKNQTDLNNTDTINKATLISIPPKPKNYNPRIAHMPSPVKNIHNDSASKPLDNRFIAQNTSGSNTTGKPTMKTNNGLVNQTVTVRDTIAKTAVIASTQKSNRSIIDTIAKKIVIASLQKPASPAIIGSKEDKLRFMQTVKKVSEQEKVKFSVYAATYFNYANGSNNQLNLGAGATADIRISENIKLSTGIAIAQNTLNYSNYPQSISIAYFQQSIPLADQLASGNSSLYNTSYTPPALTVKNYKAQLIGLDVPINLKYEFSPQKNINYFSVGLSSGTFINESYTYQYNYNGNAPQSQTTNNSFSNFYFAKTLNVSFGVGYPLGKNHLVIEPFLKYPLQGLGEQQIHFGAGGINLKFDLQSSKK